MDLRNSTHVYRSDLQYVGGGIQTLCYQHPQNSNKILKRIAVSSMDDGHLQFIKLCLQHSSNVHFPNCYNISLFDHTTHKSWEPKFKRFKYVVEVEMEKLQPVYNPHGVIPEHKQLIQSQLNVDIDCCDEDYPGMATGFNQDRYVGHAYQNRRSHIYQTMSCVTMKQAIDILEPYFTQHLCDIRLHNVMLRGETVVIIDPFDPNINLHHLS